MFVINGDGSDTFSNYDRLVFRTYNGNSSLNQIRLDKGGGGTGFNTYKGLQVYPFQSGIWVNVFVSDSVGPW